MNKFQRVKDDLRTQLWSDTEEVGYRPDSFPAILLRCLKFESHTVRTELLYEYQIEIGAGLGPFAGKIWRIGLMGHSAYKENVDQLLEALNKVL